MIKKQKKDPQTRDKEKKGRDLNRHVARGRCVVKEKKGNLGGNAGINNVKWDREGGKERQRNERGLGKNPSRPDNTQVIK